MTGVVAMNDAGCIGRDGTIPWHHREDLRFFKRLTTGGTVVLGRKTWDGLPRRPLRKRPTSLPSRSSTSINTNYTRAVRPGSCARISAP